MSTPKPITTAAGWLAAASVVPLRDWCQRHLRPAPGRRAGRKSRLFATACCRRLWDHLPDPRSRAAVAASEAFADGQIDRPALARARVAATRAARGAPNPPRNSGVGWAPEDAVQLLANQGFLDVLVACTARCAYAAANLGLCKKAEEEAEQAKLLRDVLGNPFRVVAFDPAWRSEAAVALARHMYESRDFGAMPILADALQDAGCENDDVLDHCRDSAGVHVRGCWVVDLVLGKE